MRHLHGIYPLLAMAGIFQLPFHLGWISLINRLSYSSHPDPMLMTDGMLWFTDLTSPDPTGILPVIGGLVTLLNIMTSSTSSTSSAARKMRRYLYLMPLLTVPIWMTLPAAFNLYWLTNGAFQLLLINVFRSKMCKEYMGIPDYLPDTELERLNAKVTPKIDIPVVLSKKPNTRQKAKDAKK